MRLSQEQLGSLSKVAIAAAREAARLIAHYAQEELKTERKDEVESLAGQVVTKVDRLSQELIVSRLEKSMEEYELGLLAEESEDDRSRFLKDYFWCIDPLDGTLSFTEKREGYAVSIALVSREGVPQLGVVVNPAEQTLYHAVKGAGAFKNGQPIQLSDLKRSAETFTLACDRSFLQQPHYTQAIDLFKKKIRPWGYKSLKLITTGGSVMNAIWVLENVPACYFKLPKKAAGGGSLWDFAATSCIYGELNALVSDIDGNSLQLNQESLYMNHCGVIYCTDKAVRETIINLNRELSRR